jgi:hypothetical protein
VIAGSALGGTAYVEDAFGNTVTTDNSAVSVAANGGGAFAAVYAVNGVASFTHLGLYIAGAYTLTATQGSLSSAPSAPFNVVHGAFANFQITGLGSFVTAGAASSVTISAQDAFGNIVTNYSGTVHFSSTDPKAVLPTDVVFTAGNLGVVKNLKITLVTAGTQSVSVTDLASGIRNTMSGIIVNPDISSSRLVFTAVPATLTHGVTFTVIVAIEDKYGNIVTSDNTGTMTISLGTHPRGTQLSGILTAAVINGVATFTGLSVNLAGSYTLKITDSIGLASLTSAVITAT